MGNNRRDKDKIIDKFIGLYRSLCSIFFRQVPIRIKKAMAAQKMIEIGVLTKTGDIGQTEKLSPAGIGNLETLRDYVLS